MNIQKGVARGYCWMRVTNFLCTTGIIIAVLIQFNSIQFNSIQFNSIQFYFAQNITWAGCNRLALC